MEQTKSSITTHPVSPSASPEGGAGTGDYRITPLTEAAAHVAMESADAAPLILVELPPDMKALPVALDPGLEGDEDEETDGPF